MSLGLAEASELDRPEATSRRSREGRERWSRVAEQETTVEAGLARLEAIAEKLEDTELDLGAAMALYEEGLTLYESVARQLDAAELRVTQLQKALEEQAKKPR